MCAANTAQLIFQLSNKYLAASNSSNGSSHYQVLRGVTSAENLVLGILGKKQLNNIDIGECINNARIALECFVSQESKIPTYIENRFAEIDQGINLRRQLTTRLEQSRVSPLEIESKSRT